MGTAFFAWLLENRPAARYRLETEPDNVRAKALYRRQGFEFLNYESFIPGKEKSAVSSKRKRRRAAPQR